jgi:hypothetical protein
MNQLSTSLDVRVDVQPKIAGITKGTFENDWLLCPFTIRSAPPGSRGVVWEAVFFTTDTKESKAFKGAAETRNQAVKVVTEILSLHMAQTAQDRSMSRGVQLVDYGGVTAPAPGLRAALKRLWFRFKALWTSRR